MLTLRVGVLYFAIVFGVGFVLGAIRTLWVVPRLGTRTAELMEAPIMLMTIVAVARWMVRRFAELTMPELLATGFIALGLMLATEFTVVIRIRRLTLRSYLAARDPVSGAVFYILLGLFAIMPLLLSFR